MRRFSFLLGLLVVGGVGVGVSTSRTHGQPDAAKDAGGRRVTATGVGTVAVKPDAVRVSFAFRANRGALKDTAAELDKRGADLEKELAGLKVANLTVKKGALNLHENPFGPAGFPGGPLPMGGIGGPMPGGIPPGGGPVPGGPGAFPGMQPAADASRTYTVVVKLDKGGDVKDLVAAADQVLTTAVAAGATATPVYNPQTNGFFGGGGNHATNGRVEFFRTDAAAARQEALKLAVADAAANARAAAGVGNPTLKDVVTLTDQPAGGYFGGFGGGGAQRPEVLGEYDVTVTVSVTYNY